MITLINPTTNNGSFETNDITGGATQVDFAPTTSGAAASAANPVPYWGVSAPATGINSGVSDSASTGIIEDGSSGAFEQPGGNIFNLVTSRPIAAGDSYTLSFYGLDSQGGVRSSTVGVTFYSQAAPAAGAAYGFSGTALSAATSEVLSSGGFSSYTVTFAPTTAIGSDIGIEIADTGGDYVGLDNFVLTVTPGAAVPEPRTCVLLAGGLMGLLFLRRRARA